MHWIDLLIFFIYMLLMLGVGFFFFRKNKDMDDYYVGGRKMSSWHIGLSVVATDVGGGFSIGLGGLGFMIGLAGTWMLFTGLIGAWLTAVILIPRVYKLAADKEFLTFPQLLSHYYDRRVALTAGIISAIGYTGFTSSQILAGAKLASASFISLDLQTAVIIMGFIAVAYTVMGGLKAVIYTDTIQWIILMTGLIGIGLPVSYFALGGYREISSVIPSGFFSFSNVAWQDLLKWAVTIIPIWFVGMTIYQRIYASKSKQTARKAWYIAGIFEWPLMAFMGVLLGLFARVAFEKGMFTGLGYHPGIAFDEEMGIPVLLRTFLPVGLMGLMLSAYFSAILSTADSCLMAASGNIQTDLSGKYLNRMSERYRLRASQVITLLIGAFALVLALNMPNVLSLMLYSYAFMVSGLFVPVIGALFFRKKTSTAAFWAMIGGGSITLLLSILAWRLPFGLDANVFGIAGSFLIFIFLVRIKESSDHRAPESVDSGSGGG